MNWLNVYTFETSFVFQVGSKNSDKNTIQNFKALKERSVATNKADYIVALFAAKQGIIDSALVTKAVFDSLCGDSAKEPA